MWNYRVTKQEHFGEIDYSIREFYYNDKDSPPWGYTENPASPYGETPEELKADLERMLSAFDDPVLDLDNLTLDKGPGV